MAEKKQTSKKSANPAKKTNVKNNTNKSKAKQTPLLVEGSQTLPIIIFAVSIILFCIAAFPGSGDSLWDSLRNLHFGLWGFSAFLYPLALIYLAVLLTNINVKVQSLIRFFEILVFIFLLSSSIHIFTAEINDTSTYLELIKTEYSLFKDTGSMFGSGFFSAVFGAALLMISKTRPPAVIIILLLLFVFVMLITKSSLGALITAIKTPAEKAGRYTKEKLEILAEEHLKEKEERKNNIDYKTPEIFLNKKQNEQDEQDKDIPFVPDVEVEPLAEDENVVDDFIAIVNGQAKLVNAKTPNVKADVVVHEIKKDTKESNSLEDIFETLQKKEDEEKKLKTKEPDKLFIEEEKENTTKKAAKTDSEDKEKSFDKWAEEENEGFKAEESEIIENYLLPPIDLLSLPDSSSKTALSIDELRLNADRLIEALKSFNVDAKILDIVPGPSVTRYELSPAPGMKISRFTSLADDLALHMAAPAGVRIEAPIPNKPAIGIEVPNKGRASVPIREILESEKFLKSKSKLTVALGKDIAGNAVCTDLSKMPHLLIAGTTGSGKSVCLNTLIVSLLYNSTPNEVKLLLIDPKQVEFSVYNGIPHLLVPVVNDPRKAAGALAWAVTEMVNRYKILNQSGARDISAYNELCERDSEYKKLPQVVIVIDELSDLMTIAANEVEDSITRLAQMARAAGMHLVVATQRPSVDVITGLIKANIPSRIALSVSSQIDSRTIIDTAGAEKLLGLGDMLFCPVGKQKNLRVQGCFISNKEIKSVVNYIKGQKSGEYDEEIQEEIDRQAVVDKKKSASSSSSEDITWQNDELLKQAIDFVVTNPESCSISALQRKLSLGFSKAGRYMDIMEEQGYVGPNEGSRPRKVLMSKSQWLEAQALSSGDNTSNSNEDTNAES